MAHKVTLIPGDGSGPEVVAAAKRVVEATGVAIEWDEMEAGAAMIEKYGTPLPDHVIDSIRKNGVALKGPITTPVGKGFRSVNVALRKTFDLYANVRPAKTYPGLITRYDHIDLVIVRENTEDLYAGIEHMVGEDAAESIKLITRKGCERICRYAFEYAVREGRKKVTAVHKANIMKCTDGLFLDVAREIAKEYPEIEGDDKIIDNTCADAKRKASAKLWLDMLFKHCAIFDICGFADFSLLQTKPFVAVICKSVLCRIGWNGLSIHQCGFIFRNLFLSKSHI